MKKMDFNSLLEMDLEREKKKQKKLSDSKNTEKSKMNIESIFDVEMFQNIRNRVRKNFFIGFGFGLIIASSAFWIFSDSKMIKNSNDLNDKYTDAKIIEKAKALGMIFPEEIKVEEVNNG